MIIEFGPSRCERALWLRHGADLAAVSAVPVTITCPEEKE